MTIQEQYARENDLRLLEGYYTRELQTISGSDWEARNNKVAIEMKYSVLREALVGLHELNIRLTVSLHRLINEYPYI